MASHKKSLFLAWTLDYTHVKFAGFAICYIKNIVKKGELYEFCKRHN